MSPFAHCHACPRNDNTCPAATHARYCELAALDAAALAADPTHDAYWLRFLAGAEGASRFPAPPSLAGCGPCPQ